MGIALSFAATASLADAPQAVTITTQLEFFPESTIGVFQASGPICETGTVIALSEKFGEGPAAFNVNAVQLFTCDDNSGTFMIRLHPQGNKRPKEGFTLNGPWSIWAKGTGAYASLSGHGEFGVVVNFDNDPVTGEETYVGFITLTK
jgi:hypothetical protein